MPRCESWLHLPRSPLLRRGTPCLGGQVPAQTGRSPLSLAAPRSGGQLPAQMGSSLLRRAAAPGFTEWIQEESTEEVPITEPQGPPELPGLGDSHRPAPALCNETGVLGEAPGVTLSLAGTAGTRAGMVPRGQPAAGFGVWGPLRHTACRRIMATLSPPWWPGLGELAETHMLRGGPEVA